MRTIEWAAFVALTLIWGASFLWIKIAVEDIGPQSLVGIRLLFGLIGLLPFVAAQRVPLPRGRRTWTALVVVGITSTTGPWFLISWAEQWIDSALATVLNSTVPLFTLLIAHMALRDDRMNRWKVTGLLAGFVGVLVLMRRGTSADSTAVEGIRASILGPLAMLGAAVSYATSAVYARRALRHMRASAQAFYTTLVASVLTWVLLIFAEGGVEWPGGWLTWLAIGWLGVLGAGIALFLFYYLLHAVGATKSSLVTYTIPLVGVSLGVVVLKERLDLSLVLGTILIVSGVGIVNRR